MARHPARVVLLACSLPVAACGTSDPALPLAPDVGEEPAEADPARGVRFVDIGASYAHTCALDDAGAAWCWGFNGDGRLGDGTTADRTVPTPVAGGHTFVSLGVGDAHTCGLRADGVVLCWGANVRGQLGDGDAPPPGDFGPVVFDSLPQPVAGDHRFASLSVGLHHACALEEDGSAYCWGANEMGQLGDGTFVDRDVPTPVAGGHRFASLHAGGLTCGFRLDSTLLCWGRDPSDCACEALPHRVAPGRAFTTVAVALHVCGLEADGRAFCWGENLSGQIGDGTRANRPAPTAVSGGRAFAEISAQLSSTCALTDAGAAFCWGSNPFGQIGNGSSGDDVRAPAAVEGGIAFASLSAGRLHTCGVDPEGVAWCWGWNDFGQLGEGTTSQRLTPVPVAQPAAAAPPLLAARTGRARTPGSG